MTHDVRETLHEVASDTPAPPVDEVAFRSLVRRARRRRTSTRLAAVGAAAASVAAVAALALPLVTSDRADDAPADADRTAVREGRLHEPVYLTRGGRLFALDPNGVTHDLHFSSEGVVGFTGEFALVLDRDSHQVRFDADSVDEGPDGTWTFTRGTSPVPFTVGSAAMSTDGRWLAVSDVRGDLTRYDLKAGTRSVDHLGGDPSVVDVAAAGTLVMSDGDLKLLRTDDGETVVRSGSEGYAASIGGDRVAVPGKDGRTHVYDLAGDKVSTTDGDGALSPDGRTLLAIRSTRDDVTSVWAWTPKDEHELPGIAGYAIDLRWVDEDTGLVTTGRDLWVCETRDGACGRLTLGGSGDIRIGR
jgi:hypothetical protein